MEKLAQKPSLTLTRRYPVAPEKIWRAWTDPQALRQWWAPVSAAELDLRVGGRFRVVFGGADGKENECAGVYKEVTPNRKLSFTWHWPRTTPERISLVTLTFTPIGHETELVLRHEQFFDEKARDGHKQGWTLSLEKLAAFLQSNT
ncbi:MAG TPA: SRPBCC domain-containing protein [Burkholderiales bacterium]|nr:SRPBCC domain-containing protein [Burkholderiales bacterium]